MLQQRIESLIKLKEKLHFDNETFVEVAQRAEAENPWFTKEFIELSVENICSSFLDENELIAFAGAYTPCNEVKNVGLVLAGNIPMVGFHDLLCGVLSGHRLHIKLSSKDKTLMTYIINELRAHNPELENLIQISETLKNCDAYIATGSNQSNVYFEQYFGKYPSILRKSRSSIAILTGKETTEELNELGNDVHLYFGLGCRNVSKIYVPKNYDFLPLITSFKKFEYLADMHKYKNNLDYNLSLLLLNQTVYMSTQALLVVENENTHAPISSLHYEFYSNEKDVRDQVANDIAIQAIVSSQDIPFGQAQSPSLTEFADGVDTMSFLSGL